MLKIGKTNQFKRDYKLCKKRGWDMELLKEAIRILSIPEPLPEAYQEHPLLDSYKGHKDCHVASDWLLIYRIESDELMLYRTGTHSDLFGR